MTGRPEEEERGAGASSAGQRQTRWSPRRFVLLVSVVVVLLIGGWVGWYLLRLGRAANQAFQEIFVTPAPRPSLAVPASPRPTAAPTTIRLATPTPTPTELPTWEGSEPVTLLLIGVDTTPERAGEGALPLADAIILARVDPVAESAVLLSIPRDLLVEIPGVGWDRINAAYAYGEASGTTGPALLMATIERNFGVHVDAFAQVDFQGFIRLVDLLGGVVVDVPAPIKDDEFPGPAFTYQRVYFSPGLQRFDGERALAYVRTRHDDNDLERGLRQQRVLRALRAQALRVDALRRVPELLAALGDAVRTDLPPRRALALARLGLELSPDRIESVTLASFVSDATLSSGAAVLVGDWPAIRSEVARLFGTAATP
ncbi:MAG: LCP family protein [Thermomicrobium sp.]|nr:LCP family protein [Thermomicrobium sp.]MDW8059145.1 LCP family protein [Thermomicrobium sp.]